MKKLIFIFMILFSVGSSAQEGMKTLVGETARTLTLEETIRPYVKRLLDNAETGGEWAAEQVPVVIQQYLFFEAARYALILLLGVLFLTVIRRGITSFFLKKSKEDPKTEDERYYIKYREVRKNRWLRYDSNTTGVTPEQIFYPIIKFSCYLTGGLIIICNIATFVKVTFFPKLYLVQKFIELI